MTPFAAVVVFSCIALSSSSNYNETEAILYAEFARVSFCHQTAVENWSCGDMCDAVEAAGQKPSKIRYLLGGAKWSVPGFVAKLTGKRCVLAFRGSIDFKNWIADAYATHSPWPTDQASWCPNCTVHNGIADAWAEMRPRVLDAVTDFECKSIAVAGHSLGGGVTTVAVMELRARYGMEVHPVYTYGCPRVGNAQFVEAFIRAGEQAGHSPAQWRVVHYHDPVPHLAPIVPALGSWNYKHTTREVYYNRDSSDHIVCSSVDGEDQNCSAGVSWHNIFNLDHLTYFNKTFAHKKMNTKCTGKVQSEIVV